MHPRHSTNQNYDISHSKGGMHIAVFVDMEKSCYYHYRQHSQKRGNANVKNANVLFDKCFLPFLSIIYASSKLVFIQKQVLFYCSDFLTFFLPTFFVFPVFDNDNLYAYI